MKKKDIENLLFFYPSKQFNNINIAELNTDNSIENYIIAKIDCYKSLNEIRTQELSLILSRKKSVKFLNYFSIY
jgi:hypothetical protein